MVKNLPANARDIRDTGLTPGLGRSHGGGQPTPSFLPRESHEQRSLEGWVSWGPSESGSTDSGFWYLCLLLNVFLGGAVEGCLPNRHDLFFFTSTQLLYLEMLKKRYIFQPCSS